MKDLKRIQEEFITILLLLLTLIFTSSNLTPELLLEDNSVSQRLSKVAATN
ncbi:MAG: hypothetical protein AAGE84_02485 [Cyanobacteria bacterium P01_G01_bin.39]